MKKTFANIQKNSPAGPARVWLVLLGFIVLGLMTGLGVGQGRLYFVRGELRERLDAAEGQKKALKETYDAQREKIAVMERGKARVLGEKRALEQELEELTKEREQAAADATGPLRAALTEKENTVHTLEAEAGDLERKTAELTARRDKSRQELAETLRSNQQEKERFASEIAGLEESIRDFHQRIDECRKQNRELAVAAGRLLEKLRNKGVTDVMAVAHPLSKDEQAVLEAAGSAFGDRIRQMAKPDGDGSDTPETKQL